MGATIADFKRNAKSAYLIFCLGKCKVQVRFQYEETKTKERKTVMSTPYIKFQELFISVLIRILETGKKGEKYLRGLARRVREYPDQPLADEDLEYLKSQGLELPPDEEFPKHRWVAKACVEIPAEQIDDHGEKVIIRNLLGWPLIRYQKISLEDWERYGGRHGCPLRAVTFAQPGALEKGDVLATGERLISPPREGGNGAVLLHLSEEGRCDSYGTWIDVPARIPIALRVR